MGIKSNCFVLFIFIYVTSFCLFLSFHLYQDLLLLADVCKLALPEVNQEKAYSHLELDNNQLIAT